jgi:hypothetical protein
MLTSGEILKAVLGAEAHEGSLADKTGSFQDLIAGLAAVRAWRPEVFDFFIQEQPEGGVRIIAEFNGATIIVMDTLEITVDDELILNGRNLSRDPLMLVRKRDEIVTELIATAAGRAARCKREYDTNLKKVCA